MDMVGGYGIIQHAQAEAFPGLEQPVQPSLAVPCKAQKEFLLMTAMRDVPYMVGT
jgi:hypothetical protein